MLRRLVAWLILGGLLVLAGLVGFWAGRVALEPPDDPLAVPEEPVTFEVVEQSVGRSLRFAAVGEWEVSPLARAGSAGVVTSVGFVSGDEVGVGDALYTVGLRPVVVAEGAVPAFRDMARSVEGADVRQLQEFLAGAGYLNVEADGVFGSATVAAVRAWQDDVGVDDDGVVRLGDVMFVDSLPARVAATEALVVGAPLGGGEVVLNRLAGEPRVWVPLSPEQRNLVPLSGEVRVSYPGGVWEAVIAEAVESTVQGIVSLDLVLEAPGGGPVCGSSCAEWVSLTGRTDFGAEVVVVPETTGPVVPAAAIVTDAGGGHSVRLVSGATVPVEVVESTNSLAVVSGVDAGDVVVLPFGAPGEG